MIPAAVLTAETITVNMPVNLPTSPTAATSTLPNCPIVKIGKTTYFVWAHFSETSTETMEDKIKRMLREEVRQMMVDE